MLVFEGGLDPWVEIDPAARSATRNVVCCGLRWLLNRFEALVIDAARTISLIERKLTPYVGAHMAHASIKAHIEALGLGGRSEIASADFDALLARLTRGLRIFLGGNKAEQLIREIRADLHVEGVA